MSLKENQVGSRALLWLKHGYILREGVKRLEGGPESLVQVRKLVRSEALGAGS